MLPVGTKIGLAYEKLEPLFQIHQFISKKHLQLFELLRLVSFADTEGLALLTNLILPHYLT